MVSRITPVIAKSAEDIPRLIFRWRDIVPQLRVTIWLIVFLICCFLLGRAMKQLSVEGQTGAFKPLITLSNLVLGLALVCQSIQTLNGFVSEFTLLTRKCE
jgi:FtsH-binding integral membrane protein